MNNFHFHFLVCRIQSPRCCCARKYTHILDPWDFFFFFIVEWFFLPSPLLKDVRCCVTFPHIHTQRHSHEINIFENHKTNFSTWFDTISITGMGLGMTHTEKHRRCHRHHDFIIYFLTWMRENEKRERAKWNNKEEKKVLLYTSAMIYSHLLWLCGSFFFFFRILSLFFILSPYRYVLFISNESTRPRPCTSLWRQEARSEYVNTESHLDRAHSEFLMLLFSIFLLIHMKHCFV